MTPRDPAVKTEIQGSRLQKAERKYSEVQTPPFQVWQMPWPSSVKRALPTAIIPNNSVIYQEFQDLRKCGNIHSPN